MSGTPVRRATCFKAGAAVPAAAVHFDVALGMVCAGWLVQREQGGSRPGVSGCRPRRCGVWASGGAVGGGAQLATLLKPLMLQANEERRLLVTAAAERTEGKLL